MAKSTIKLYPHKIKKLTDAQWMALEKTAEALHTDVVQAQVIPRDSGQSQSGTVTIVHQTPYARRLYYHPEYNFRTVENANAQGKWFEPWIDGDKKDFCQKAYAKFFKEIGGV